MRVRELRVDNFRKFRKPVRLADFGDGLNLVCEPNEAGKSTVLEALRAALFERHGSRSDRIRSFRPHGDEVAPTVELDFEIDGAAWSLRKRFLQSPSVTLEGPGGRFQSDEAEEKLQLLLGFTRAGNRGADDDSRGALGLLWVEQGQSFVLGAPGQSARRTLEDVLAGEVGAVTGGRRTAAVAQAVEKALSELQTATGRPTKRLQEAFEAAQAAQEACDAARRELNEFEDVLTRLEAKRSEQRRLVRELEDPEAAEQFAQLAKDVDRAKAAAQALKTAELVLNQATGERSRLETASAAREKLRADLGTARAKAKAAQRDVDEHVATLEAARTYEREAEAALADKRRLLRSAEDARAALLAEQDALQTRRRLAQAFARLDRAEALAAELERHAAAVAAEPMDEAASDDLDRLDRAVVQARSAAEAGAATVEIALQPGAPAPFMNGDPLPPDESVAVTETLRLSIPGVADVIIEPPATGELAQARLRAAEQDLQSFLERVGHASVTDARAAARKRNQAAQQAASLAVRLDAECAPDAGLEIGSGLEALRGFLAAQARPEEGAAAADSGQASLEELEAAYQAARAAERDAEVRRQGTLDALQAAQLEEVRRASIASAANAEEERMTLQLKAEEDAITDAALEAELAVVAAAEARAIQDHDGARRAAEALDEDALTKRKETADRRRQRMQEDRLTLVGDVVRLEEAAKSLGGAGPASRLAAAEEVAQATREVADRLNEEAETLALLKRVIGAAQQEASRRFLQPITRRVEPYVRRLLPSATISFGEDYRPRMLTRGGREEAAEDLSKGTQEQLAVLTRIAFADLLIDKGKPASLVLDDALVFADDDRFEVMLEILAEAAQRMQVIVLSCRASAYRGIEANRIEIS
ncbi:MAG: AAA family ATPase [Pseudomonadota bacterium]